ncbi:FitA-like ribbon-helix-helix domain-containing protein [Corynebacterium terpenotabidum]|nr:plasmid stabilization protein [Corynebacterium terpenotabidum]
MANLTVRNVPDDIHRALRAQAKAHGRSAEAEVRQILGDALIPSNRLHIGDALAALGRELDLTDEDVDVLESTRNRSSAEPMDLP